MEAVINKYRGKQLRFGLFDCNLMVLELTGYSGYQLNQYNDLKGGAKYLANLTQCHSPAEYMESIGYKLISPLKVFDGDILIKGIHCFIYYNGWLFGVSSQTNTFEFMRLGVAELSQFSAYRKQ